MSNSPLTLEEILLIINTYINTNVIMNKIKNGVLLNSTYSEIYLLLYVFSIVQSHFDHVIFNLITAFAVDRDVILDIHSAIVNIFMHNQIL